MSKNTRKDGVIFLPVNDSAFLRIIGKRHVWKNRNPAFVRFRSKHFVFQLHEFGRISFCISSKWKCRMFRTESFRKRIRAVRWTEFCSVPAKMPRAGMFRPKVKSADETGKKFDYRNEDHLFPKCFSLWR